MNRIQDTRILFIACIAAVVSLVSLSQGWSGESLQGTLRFTLDPVSTESKDTFSGFDKIYALATISGLTPGTHEAVINWIDPTGKVNQNNVIPFTVQGQTSYTFYAWIRLLENGPLKSTLSGKDFDDEYIGKWELHLFVNGILLQKKQFNIY